MKNNKNDVKGITLLTLIITIVVLLILASIATYSGSEVIKSSRLTTFTTEMKIMQTQVNELYEKYKNGDNEILNLGKGLDEVQKQADIVFSLGASGIIEQSGYRYFDQETIQDLNIEGVKEKFFINVEKRSVVSYEGFKYDDETYYTLEQLPNGLYNVDYENKNTGTPTFEASVEKIIGENKWKVSISNIQYNEGYIDKWKVKYKLNNQENWNTSEDYSFVVNESGKYTLQLINGNIKSEEKEIITKEVENILQSEYQQVKYIESTGTQYIDTGIGSSNIGQTMRIELDFQLTEYVNNTWICGTKELECGCFYGFYSHFTYSQTNDYLARTTATGSATKTSDSKVLIFARDYNGTTNEYRPAKVKIYSTLIYLDNELVRNFIPCYRKTDNVIGMYDLVENKFYTNQGTGTFEKGDDENP